MRTPWLASLLLCASAGCSGPVQVTPPPSPDPRERPPNAEASIRCQPAEHFESGRGCVANAPPPNPESLTKEGCPEGMIFVPGGTFLFGTPDVKSRNPSRSVNALPVCIGRTEVTVAQYASCVSAGKCPPASKTMFLGDMAEEGGAETDDLCNADKADRQGHPINCVNMTMAEAYCWWTNARLPSEIEWEHAARGADGRDFPWGSDSPAPPLMNGCDAECKGLAESLGKRVGLLFPGSDGFASTAPVGTYPRGASPYGALDMAGNVSEWTASPFCPGAGETCRTKLKVLRGGAFNMGKEGYVRVSNREPKDPSTRLPSIGIRCARSPERRP